MENGKGKKIHPNNKKGQIPVQQIVVFGACLVKPEQGEVSMFGTK